MVQESNYGSIHKVHFDLSNQRIIVLSAKNKERLSEQVEQLRKEIENRKFTEDDLDNIGYTLQVGREHMETRVGLLVTSISELQEKLNAFIEERDEIIDLYQKAENDSEAVISEISNEEGFETVIDNLIQKRRYGKLLEFWVKGVNFDWEKLYAGMEAKPHIISLPTYPFAKEEYWLPTQIGRTCKSGEQTRILHPLVHTNTSDFDGQQFMVKFTGTENFMNKIDNDTSMLSEVTYLEMIRAAVALSIKEETYGISLTNITWNKPLLVGKQGTEVRIGLYLEDNEQISWEVYEETGSGEIDVIPCEGTANLIEDNKLQQLDISELRSICSHRMDFCDTENIINDLWEAEESRVNGKGNLLVKFKQNNLNSNEEYEEPVALNPIYLKACLNVVNDYIGIPYNMSRLLSMKKLDVISEPGDIVWAHIKMERKEDVSTWTLDVELGDIDGNCIGKLEALQVSQSEQVIARKDEVQTENQTCEAMTFEEIWEEETVNFDVAQSQKTLIIFLSKESYQQEVNKWVKELGSETRVIYIEQGTTYKKQLKEKYIINYSNDEHYKRCLQEIKDDFESVDNMLYLWPLEDKKCIVDTSGIVYILQGLSKVSLDLKQIMLAGGYEDSVTRCYVESLIGFERSIAQIINGTKVKVICREQNSGETFGVWKHAILNELKTSDNKSVLYEEGKRKICQVKPVSIAGRKEVLKMDGTYLITGGMGGLGLIFAHYLAVNYHANLILINRSRLEDKTEQLEELRSLGVDVMYIQSDVCDVNRMQAGVNAAKNHFGKIDGVIHAAGIEGGTSLLQKNIKEYQQILEPKVKGTQVLEEVLAEEQLDFICYFSSSAAILGDFGACAYAVANRFLTCFGKYYEGSRKGSQPKRIVINWPLWKDGGMHLKDEQSNLMYLKSSGQKLLGSEKGTELFEMFLRQDSIQHLVLIGQPEKINRILGLSKTEKLEEKNTQGSLRYEHGKGKRPNMQGWDIEQCVLWDLKNIVFEILRIPQDKIEIEDNLADFGFDSISLSRFANILSDCFEFTITPDLFFSYATLEKIGAYLIKNYPENMKACYKEETELKVSSVPVKGYEAGLHNKNRTIKRKRVRQDSRNKNDEDAIAIIGMSGRFPGARNVDEFWSILQDGREVVQKMPEERAAIWEKCGYSVDEMDESCKLGIVPGVAEFDPYFFDISPREAELMDPRQRILLEETWKALEDAGYGSMSIEKERIGMFVGVEEGDYSLLVGEEGNITGNNNAVLAARLAYFLNLNGPNMAINTACSSGLMAVHQACLSLKNGDCDTAIVAGVSLLLTPGNYESMRKAGMLSTDGRCHAFDKRANGMIPSEAIAAVVLKRRSKAEKDNNPIYAAIVGSGVNYDGKTNGITAPSGLAQTKLLKEVYERYHIKPSDISYIVTHGTGTKIGDPIEINALIQVFKEYAVKSGSCALTSVKSNIGHTMAASGIVSLISLAMSLKKEMIPGSINCEQPNDYIQWNGSAFYINQEDKKWTDIDGKKRLGGVSAFGMSGTNIHVVLESYGSESSEKRFMNEQQSRKPYYLLAFSAKTKEALQIKIQEMEEKLTTDSEVGSGVLSSISYTLLVGRQHFKHRFAIVVRDKEDAIQTLRQARDGSKLPNLFHSEVAKNFKPQEIMNKSIEDLIEQSCTPECDAKKYQEILYALAEFYCLGYENNYDGIWGENKPRLCSVPTYPFARDEYWIHADKEQRKATEEEFRVLHPLVQENTSDLRSQRFSSKFTGKEDFLVD